MPSGQDASEARRIIYRTPYESYCAIVAAVIVRAYDDARGKVEKEPENKQQRIDIIQDAAQYFNDDRYRVAHGAARTRPGTQAGLEQAMTWQLVAIAFCSVCFFFSFIAFLAAWAAMASAAVDDER